MLRAACIMGDGIVKTYRIFVINPGSTSTKLSMFENDRCLFTEDTFHDSSVLMTFPTISVMQSS